MFLTRRLVLITTLFALAACTSSSPSDRAAEKAEIDAGADAALSKLFAENPAAKTLAGRAKGIAIFPNIVKGGLGVGASLAMASFASVASPSPITTPRALRSAFRRGFNRTLRY